MADLEVRPARAEDRAAIFALCAHTWDDGDYIPDVWDQWLADTGGILLTGVLDGQPVALVHVRMMSHEEGWLEGLRVDPVHRHSGFGRVMTSRALAAAHDRGAQVVRLLTGAENHAAQRLVARFGFIQVGAFVPYEAPAADAPQPDVIPPDARLTVPGASAADRIWTFLQASNLVPLNGGLIFDYWAGQVLTQSLLRQHLAQGAVRTLEAWNSIQALAIVRPQNEAEREAWLEVEYLDGMAEGIGRIALALRGEAAQRGLTRVALTIPDLLILHDAMDGAGYQRWDGGAFWCYARQF